MQRFMLRAGGPTLGTDHFSMPELEKRGNFSSYQDSGLKLDSGDALESHFQGAATQHENLNWEHSPSACGNVWNVEPLPPQPPHPPTPQWFNR